jgi:hypothetical protein
MDCPKCGSPNLIEGTICIYCGFLQGADASRLDIFPFNNKYLVLKNESNTVGVVQYPNGVDYFCVYIVLPESIFPKGLFGKGNDIEFEKIYLHVPDIEVVGGITFGKRVKSYIILGWDSWHPGIEDTREGYLIAEGVKVYNKIVKTLTGR